MAIPRNLANIAPSVAGNSDGVTGITFAATQSASADANTLDDYEEGTWTPVYQGTGGSIGSTAYSAQNGYYIKVGSIVTVGMRVILTNKGSWTGVAYFSGLPFASQNNSIQNMGSAWTVYVTFADQVNARVGPNESNLVLRVNTSGAGGDYLQTSAIANNSEFNCTVTYRV